MGKLDPQVQALLAKVEKLHRSGTPEDCAAVAEACYQAVQEGAPLDVAERAAGLLAACRARLPETDGRHVILHAIESSCWRVRYLRVGNERDLRRAIKAIDAAFALTEPGHPLHHEVRADRATMYALLPGADAIDALRAAVAAPDADPLTRARDMLNLVNELQQRYLATRDSTALDEALALADQALALDPRTDDNWFWWRLMRAAQPYAFKGIETDDPGLLGKAVDLAQQAVVLLPPGHPYLPGMLNQLGSIMHARAVLTSSGDAQHRELAVAVHLLRTSVRMADPAMPDYPSFTANLATALRTLWKETGDQSLLDEAIKVAERGGRAAATSPTARDRETLDRMVGMLRGERNQRDPAAVRVLAGSFAGAHRLDAVLTGQAGAGLAAAVGDWKTAADLARRAAELLPHAVSAAMSLKDRERGLAVIATDLARDACALALQANRPADEALQVLETARATLIGQALIRHRNADLDPVRDVAPQLAARMEHLRADLVQVEDAPYGPAADRRHRLTNEMRELTQHIRAVPGLERYLLPPDPTDLSRRAGAVPVVTVNISRYRCDALILREGTKTTAVPLPDLTLQDTVQRAEQFTTAIAQLSRSPQPGPREAKQHRAAVRDVLAWLWEAVADPVLTALGITAAPATGTLLPRLRWSPTGPLTLLPLHAAEPPETPDMSVMARVISSYVPTLRLLGDFQGTAVSAHRREGHLIVPVPHSSLMPKNSLEGAAREATHLASVLPEARLLPIEGVSALAVTAGLGGARGVHFACHGVSNTHHPSRSHLVLRNETLTAADLMSHRLDGLGLAFLSACHTAHAGTQLPDETLHLTSAFRMAGARNVVGTLWQAGDESSVLFTKAFYAHLGPLPDDGLHETEADRIATAVHLAAWQVRQEWPSPKAWAPFVHVG